ncbi:hypothetical protein COM33_25240 [Bacillus toyonensis]|nr:hypothetical protein CH334_04530 [Lysinibacillus sp. VIA-II-2016]KAB2401779.1 hypothetical protein F8514_28145 [Bacillus toyonensis]QEQ20653.1 hypothetical protein F0362_29355 [Bacillus sp. BS98]MBE7140416.1 hypothetical protein [Bacillus toyonensis]PEB27468.1 hypothetical protein COO14_26440 [Bacillus toyonensis]
MASDTISRWFKSQEGTLGCLFFFLKRGFPALRKKSTLRVCKILYSFSANPVTNEYSKTFSG